VVQKKLTECDPAYVDVASTEALSRPEGDDTRPCHNHGKSDQADLSPKNVSRSCVQPLHRDFGVRGPCVGNDARLEQEIQHANCEHESASVHSDSVLVALINNQIATYMRLRFSALFAGRVVKTLISTHESIQLATVKTFFRMNSKP
jgi:hypothetical protein